MDDIFLKIVRNEIPATKVYEDEHVVSFLDINPHSKGHALVIPRERYRNIFDIPEDVLCTLMRTVKKLSIAIKEATGADGINIQMNNEPAAGQVVFHAHVHIIPRFENDHVFSGARHTTYETGEMDVVAKKIKAALS